MQFFSILGKQSSHSSVNMLRNNLSSRHCGFFVNKFFEDIDSKKLQQSKVLNCDLNKGEVPPFHLFFTYKLQIPATQRNYLRGTNKYYS